jgi:hypothetical protein
VVVIAARLHYLQKVPFHALQENYLTARFGSMALSQSQSSVLMAMAASLTRTALAAW